MNKGLVLVLTIAAVGLGGYLLYKAYEKKKIDETTVPYEEALQKLEEAKQS